MNDTKWKQLDLNPNYMISDQGDIMSLNFHGTKYLNPQIMKPLLNEWGYYQVGIRDTHTGISTTYQVHTLVLRTFKSDTYFDGAECDHINGVKTDNSADNLRYVTHAENVAAAYRLGLHPPQENRRRPMEWLEDFSPADIFEILKNRVMGMSYLAIARLFSSTTDYRRISYICKQYSDTLEQMTGAIT